MAEDDLAIRGVIARWHEATAAGDVGAVLSLMAEDATFLVAGRPPMRGRAAFEQALRGLFAHGRVESKGEVREVVVSGDLAYAWTDLTVRVVPLGGGVENVRSGSALSIFRRDASGTWVLARDANLLAAPS